MSRASQNREREGERDCDLEGREAVTIRRVPIGGGWVGAGVRKTRAGREPARGY